MSRAPVDVVSSLNVCNLPSIGGDTCTDLLKRLEAEESLPSYVKLIIGVLIETKMEISDLNNLCKTILAENKVLREENNLLRSQLNSSSSSEIPTKEPSSSSQSAVAHDAGRTFPKIDPDLSRSIVVSGVPEGQSSNSIDRAQHDLQCVYTLLNFLGVECLPCHVFRMGVRNSSRPRLLKIVLPNDRFQKEVVKRASRLRFFPHKGVYIRPSLTKEERIRRREARRDCSGSGSGQADCSVMNGAGPTVTVNDTCSTGSENTLKTGLQGNL